ncbi:MULTISPECIES: CDF family Co(II)/Ni(II) efflux transporter DmeF [Cellvibrio]|uniref:Cation diffusion facilitator family transporter n=1 Tax=Cellvibrio fibrivorans TaxID=126350 RepID=A0ABU1UUT0_9GAMM|nr:CDF family Co(II)/Ni(II) efflux transporter DmeF [Cellvibrio fibrivorans]MDR7088950.1 cation diffusion facilitator family transporter [Cellvibrio fibrivorans]
MTTQAYFKTCHHPIPTQTNPLAEKNTRRALMLTAAMMLIEIIGGWYYNSMALLADGWHMSSHVVALGLALFAYVIARKLAQDGRFSFGVWKIEVLGGYTSAILLLLVAVTMFYQSAARLITPVAIHYNEAITLAIVGLLVNLMCAWWLKDGHHHHHEHDHHHEDDHAHHHEHSHAHEDLNLRAAYMHVVADAATSMLAIIALFGGKLFGADWLDPVMGIVGGVLVAVWALGLLRTSGRALLDAEMDAPVVEEIRAVIAAGTVPAEIRDLHVWRVGRNQYACVLSLITQADVDADFFKQQVQVHEELVHITIEIAKN